jgi:uncharacterized protein YegP (UPF0339 family)
MIEIKQKKNNVYRFFIKAKSGKTLLKSIPFSSKDSIEKFLKFLKDNKDVNEKLFERKTNADGKFLVELKNSLGEIVGCSGLYSSEAGMENGILNIFKSIDFGSKKI